MLVVLPSSDADVTPIPCQLSTFEQTLHHSMILPPTRTPLNGLLPPSAVVEVEPGPSLATSPELFTSLVGAARAREVSRVVMRKEVRIVTVFGLELDSKMVRICKPV